MITMGQLIKEIKLSRNTILKLISEGLPVVRVGKKYLFDLVEIKTWLKDNK